MLSKSEITSLVSTPKIGIDLDDASILREPWPWWDEDPMGHEIELTKASVPIVPVTSLLMQIYCLFMLILVMPCLDILGGYCPFFMEFE